MLKEEKSGKYWISHAMHKEIQGTMKRLMTCETCPLPSFAYNCTFLENILYLQMPFSSVKLVSISVYVSQML